MAIIYCTSAGAGSHDGTSVANAFSWAELITDINAGNASQDEIRICGDIDHGGTAKSITASGSTTQWTTIYGYNSGGTTRQQVNIDEGATGTDVTGTVLNITGNYYTFHDIIIGDATTGAWDCDGPYLALFNCEAHDAPTGFTGDSNYCVYYGCRAYNCTTRGFYEYRLGLTYGCVAHGCGVGFRNYHVANCLSYDNTTAFEVISAVNCTAEGCSSNGYSRQSSSFGMRLANCLSVNNYRGYLSSNSNDVLYYCGDYGNTVGRGTGLKWDFNDPSLTGDPFTDSASNDYTLNDTAGAGAACKGAGYDTDSMANFPGAPHIGNQFYVEPAASGGLLYSPDLSGQMA